MNITTIQRLLSAGTFALGAAMAGTATPLAFAGIGSPGATKPATTAGTHVLPGRATPFGYSLVDMARLTAAFNEGDRSGPPPNSPFQILYVNTVTNNTSFDVARGTFFYVPIVYSDNSLPLLGDFPASVEVRGPLLNYWYSQTEIGVVTMEIIVDGKTVPTGAPYLTGIVLPQALPNGATQYIVGGAFLSPLPPGSHTVEIYTKGTGDALRKPPFDQYFPDGYFESDTVYTVIVH